MLIQEPGLKLLVGTSSSHMCTLFLSLANLFGSFAASRTWVPITKKIYLLKLCNKQRLKTTRYNKGQIKSN